MAAGSEVVPVVRHPVMVPVMPSSGRGTFGSETFCSVLGWVVKLISEVVGPLLNSRSRLCGKIQPHTFLYAFSFQNCKCKGKVTIGK